MSVPFASCYLNGDFLPLAEARISPLDRGFLFADGVYEVVPVHRGRPFLLRAHLDRLARSLREISLDAPLDEGQWAGVVAQLTGRAGAPELLVYLQVTRGADTGRNHLFPKSARSTVFAFASPYPVPSAATLDAGVSAVTMDDIRWSRCDIKSIALLPNVLQRQRAFEQGGDEALLIREGELTEGSSSTVFIVRDGTLATPPNSNRILPGTSREAVRGLAEGWLPVDVRRIEAAELHDCDEIWIASAGRGILPVTRLDGRPVGSGRPGPHWQEIYARLQRHLDEIASTPAL